MALVDLYEIVHDMTLFGQNVLSVYHVERANSGEVAGSISDAFQNDVLPPLRLLQNDAITNNEIRIFNLGNDLDFGTFTLSAALGSRLGSASPSFMAGEIRFASKIRGVRNGYKRLRGLEEIDYTDGVMLATPLALLDDIGDAMIANWTASGDAHHVCNYVIIKRVCDETDPATGKCIKYRLPRDAETPVFYKPTQFTVIGSVRSQVSSKVPI